MENLFENIFASVAEGLLIVSSGKKIIGVNPAGEDILGYSSAQILNRPIKDFFVTHPQILKKIHSSLKDGVVYLDLENEFIKPLTLQTIFLGISISPLTDAFGKIGGAVLLLRDKNKLKKFNEETNTALALAGVSTLAVSLAHEIKNPLSGIKGVAQLLHSTKNSPKESEEYLILMIKEVDRINQMVEDLLNLARPRKLDFQPVNINQVLEEIILIQKESVKGRAVIFLKDYDPSLPPIIADGEEMHKLFFNLIQNAVEAMPTKGSITVSSRFFTEYQLSVSKGKLSRVVLIEIKNPGDKIPEEDLKNVFTPFFSTKKKGTGLGLAIAHKIVEEHHGRIKLISGSDFPGMIVQIFLPILQ